jgi:CheY-like chemotaxis protein
MGKILIIDDDLAFLDFLSGYIRDYYPLLQVETCTSPFLALKSIKTDLDLLIVDLEMPQMDGCKLIKYAIDAGVDKKRIILLSSRDADYLHEHFPMGTCLAVMNKYEAGQKAVLDMIFSSLQKKISG